MLQLLFGVRFPRGPRPATKQSGGAAGSVKSKVGLQRINNIEKNRYTQQQRASGYTRNTERVHAAGAFAQHASLQVVACFCIFGDKSVFLCEFSVLNFSGVEFFRCWIVFVVKRFFHCLLWKSILFDIGRTLGPQLTTLKIETKSAFFTIVSWRHDRFSKSTSKLQFSFVNRRKISG